MLSPESPRKNKLLQAINYQRSAAKPEMISLQKSETPWNTRGTHTQHLLAQLMAAVSLLAEVSHGASPWETSASREGGSRILNRKSCGETNFVHIFIPNVHFKQKSEVSAAKKLSFTTASAIISYCARKGWLLFTDSDQMVGKKFDPRQKDRPCFLHVPAAPWGFCCYTE